MAERPYAFRKRLSEVHQKNRRVQKWLETGQIEITSEWKIVVPSKNDFLIRCGRDLEDYFFVSMGVEVPLTVRPRQSQYLIRYVVDNDLKTDGAYGIEVEKHEIRLIGKDERAAAQAGYYLEDLLNLEESPYISVGSHMRTPRFHTRMVHSGFSLDIFPNEYLNLIAHQGINSILLFTRGVDHTSYGYTDFNDIIDRASLYGIDVYAYSYMKSRKHPSDEGAEAFYDSLYGDLFRRCPGFKGIILVGESVEFPSHDERTTMRLREDNLDENGKRIIKNKPNPGWFPCRDYPEWLNMVKRIIRKEKPDADIVFWTYNWGNVDEKLRVELIEHLPTDISLEATFEMFESVDRDGVPGSATDYTLFVPEAGKYFLSEAVAAKKRGIPLYSMTNTGGLTWDVGTVPFEPAPYQWEKRFESVLSAADRYGLCGLMESHHYGFYPSFISELAKWYFCEPESNRSDILDRLIIRDWGKEHLKTVQNSYRLFSEAINDLITTNEDQYGPMRIGPSYPLVLYRDVDLKIPFGLHAMHGSNTICLPNYTYPFFRDGMKEKMIGESRLYRQSAKKLIDGAKALQELLPSLPLHKRDEAQRIAGIGEFMGRAVLTTHHTKEWYLRKNMLLEDQTADFETVLKELESIGRAEIENAKATLPLVDFDSRLGYEPSMDYMCHREAIEWKIAIQERILNEDIPQLRQDGYVKDRNPKHFPRGLWD